MGTTTAGFKAVIRRNGEWWIGWIEEVQGVNSQGATCLELLENLRNVLGEAMEMGLLEQRRSSDT